MAKFKFDVDASVFFRGENLCSEGLVNNSGAGYGVNWGRWEQGGPAGTTPGEAASPAGDLSPPARRPSRVEPERRGEEGNLSQTAKTSWTEIFPFLCDVHL